MGDRFVTIELSIRAANVLSGELQGLLAYADAVDEWTLQSVIKQIKRQVSQDTRTSSSPPPCICPDRRGSCNCEE